MSRIKLLEASVKLAEQTKLLRALTAELKRQDEYVRALERENHMLKHQLGRARLVADLKRDAAEQKLIEGPRAENIIFFKKQI